MKEADRDGIEREDDRDGVKREDDRDVIKGRMRKMALSRRNRAGR